MKVLHLSSSVNKSSAAYRLHKGLRNNGVESFVGVAFNSIKDELVLQNKNETLSKIFARIDRLPLSFYKKELTTPFNTGFKNNFNFSLLQQLDPDIIHLHWINQFVSIEEIARLKKPVVWTLHDSWAFTGGCHIPYPCDKWKTQCGNCPQLKSSKQHDLSNIIFKSKLKQWSKLKNLEIIGPSKWMTDCATNSAILGKFKASNMPNLIDTDFWNPADKRLARTRLGIDVNSKVILYGANNSKRDLNKGFQFLEQAYSLVKKTEAKVQLIVFGSGAKHFDEVNNILYWGNITDPEDLVLLYSSADLLVSPSISENFSNVILESLSCNTAVVAFDIGGNSDLIDHQKNGYLAEPFNISSLTEGINYVLNNPNTVASMREKVLAHFSESTIVNKHIVLYNNMLNRGKV